MFKCIKCNRKYLFVPGWYPPPCPFTKFDKKGLNIVTRKLYV